MRKQAHQKKSILSDPYEEWREATLGFTDSIVRECRFEQTFDGTPVWPSRDSVLNKLKAWRDRIVPIERRIKVEADRANKFDWAERELARARALVEREAAAFTYGVLELTQKGVRADLCLAKTAEAVAIVQEVREMVSELAATQRELSEEDVARELMRLKEEDKAIILALYQSRAWDLESANTYSQSRIAKILGLDHDATLNGRLSRLVHTSFLDNGKHHGLHGGYFLAPKGRVAGKVLARS